MVRKAEIGRRLLLLAVLNVVYGCDRTANTTAPQDQEKEDRVITVRFRPTVSIGTAAAAAESLQLTSAFLQSVFVVGNDSVTDFFALSGQAVAADIEGDWRDAREIFLQDLLRIASDSTSTSGQQPFLATAMLEAIQDRVTPSAVLSLTGKGTKTEEERARRLYGDAAVATHNGSSAPSIVASSTADGSSWVPSYGSVVTGASSSTERFVQNTMVFTKTEGFADKATYEHDFFLNNYAESETPGTYLSTEELTGIETHRVPKTTYAASNLPIPYLDTRFLDPQEEIAYTIGSAYPRSIVKNITYQTYIRTRNGSADRDNGKLQAQLGERRPDWCMTTWCSYGLEKRPLVKAWKIAVPGTIHWSTEALAITAIEPGSIVGLPLPQRVTLSVIGTGFASDSKVRVSWTGGSKTLDSSNVTVVSPRRIHIRVATGTDADTWSAQVLDGDGGTSNSVAFTVTAPPPPLPTAPSSLSGNATSDSVSLRWKDNATNESGFEVERAASGSSSFSQIGTTGTNDTSFTDTQVVAGNNYTYRVRAYNAAGTSSYSGTLPIAAPARSTNFTIGLLAAPENGGTVSGGGTFPAGSSVTVTATASTGYSFVRWTENGTEVSTAASYQSIASANRTLVAVFNPLSTPAAKYTISVSNAPSNGGSSTGGGSYAANDSVTLTATAVSGFSFKNWTENGAEVSAINTYEFKATSDRTLVAKFTANDTTATIAVTINPASANLTVGQKKQFTATVAGTANRAVQWFTDHPEIAGVHPDSGLVTAYYAGKATITVQSKADLTKSASATLDVTTASPPASISVVLDQSSPTIKAGETKQLTATVTGSTNTTVNWYTDHPEIATVNTSGLVTGIAAGAATVTAQSIADTSKKASAAMTVEPATPAPATPETFASNLRRPWSLATEGIRLYWVENDATQGAVRSKAISGGEINTIASNVVEPSAIVVDGTHAYWIERNNGAGGSLKKAPKNGGAITILASNLNNAQNFLAHDATALYFGDGKPGGGGAIRKVLKSGGSVITLVSDNTNLTTAVATDGVHVYFDDDRGNIKRVPVNGGSASVIAAGKPSGMVTWASTLFWVEYATGEVKKVSSSGGPVTVLATGSQSPMGIATDGAWVYWSEFTNPGTVKKVSVSGGTVTTLGTQSNSPGIVLDDFSVYWSVSVTSNGKIMRLPR